MKTQPNATRETRTKVKTVWQVRNLYTRDTKNVADFAWGHGGVYSSSKLISEHRHKEDALEAARAFPGTKFGVGIAMDAYVYQVSGDHVKRVAEFDRKGLVA